MRRFLQAMSLLTRLPTRVTWEPDLPWGRLAGWFAPVGIVVGGLAFGLSYAWTLWPAARTQPLLGAALLAAFGAAVTGALHLDGWGDCCDAFFVPADRAKRLAIMADPQVGAFGTIGLIVLLLVKTAALNGLLLRAGACAAAGDGAVSVARALWPLVAAPALARARMVLVLAGPGNRLAKPDGMGARMRMGLTWRQVAAAIVVTVFVLLPFGWHGLVLAVVAGVLGAGFTRLAHARVGGLTGDVLGGLVELVETGVLAAASLLPFAG